MQGPPEGIVMEKPVIRAQSSSVNGLSLCIDFMVHRGPAHHYQRQAFNGQVPSPTQRQSPLPQADISQKPIVNSVYVCGCVETLNWGGWGLGILGIVNLCLHHKENMYNQRLR